MYISLPAAVATAAAPTLIKMALGTSELEMENDKGNEYHQLDSIPSQFKKAVAVVSDLAQPAKTHQAPPSSSISPSTQSLLSSLFHFSFTPSLWAATHYINGEIKPYFRGVLHQYGLLAALIYSVVLEIHAENTLDFNHKSSSPMVPSASIQLLSLRVFSVGFILLFFFSSMLHRYPFKSIGSLFICQSCDHLGIFTVGAASGTPIAVIGLGRNGKQYYQMLGLLIVCWGGWGLAVMREIQKYKGGKGKERNEQQEEARLRKVKEGEEEEKMKKEKNSEKNQDELQPYTNSKNVSAASPFSASSVTVFDLLLHALHPILAAPFIISSFFSLSSTLPIVLCLSTWFCYAIGFYIFSRRGAVANWPLPEIWGYHEQFHVMITTGLACTACYIYLIV